MIQIVEATLNEDIDSILVLRGIHEREISKSEKKKEKGVRQGGIEPPAKPWKGFMLPLHH